MPFDPEDPFGSADPSPWPQAGALPRIIVHPKLPPGTPTSDGIDDWYVPGQASDGPDDWFVPTGAAADISYPDDWFVPTPSATPSAPQLAPGAQTAAINPAGSNRPAVPPDPFAALWSRIPASRVGAMAWDPPVFPGNSVNPSPTTWPAAQPASIGLTNVPKGGLLGALADLGTWSPAGTWIPAGGLLGALANLGSSATSESSIPSGGLLGALAQLGSTEPVSGAALPPPPPYAQAVSPEGRRPLADYSAGEIAGDAAKSLGVGVGQLGIQAAGLPGDAREMMARAAQRAADYFAPGSAPNVGSKVSHFLGSHLFFAGPTSSQLQNAVESYTGPFYQPKTIVGDYARTAGEIVPGALLMPEGSLTANALRYGLLPALSSETAGQLARGTAAEPWARIAGGILGAGPAAWRDLLRARSAPKVAEPLAARELSEAEQLAARRRAQLEVNKAAGVGFQNETADDLKRSGIDFAPQITLKTDSGLQTRLDFLAREPGEEKIRCIECKASETARETKNQKKAFAEIEKSGATIVGAGKPGYEGDMKIPPTKVEILRP